MLQLLYNMTTRRQNISGNTFIFTLKKDNLDILFTDGFTVLRSTIHESQDICEYLGQESRGYYASLCELFSCEQVQYINGGLKFSVTDGCTIRLLSGYVYVDASVIFPDTAQLLNGIDNIDKIDEIKRICSNNMQNLLSVTVNQNTVDANNN